jgi:transcriptional regulator with XRE-family HTH domain/tetratricopeptide (TPR) repeat protein
MIATIHVAQQGAITMALASSPSFGARLKRERMARGLTQGALAERAGLSARAVSDLERGVNRAPRKETLRLLAEALQLSPEARARLEDAVVAAVVAAPERGASMPFADPAPLPLAGRAQELAQLRRLLRGEGPPLLLLAGEPGIGKTRLLRETAARAQRAGWRVLSGGCTRRSGQASYAPFTVALAQAIAHTTRAQLRRDLQGCAWLGRLLPELIEQALVPTPTWQLPPDHERRLLFGTVGRYLANVSGPAGTLMLLDDLQWAGGDALDLLESLLRDAAAALQEASQETSEGPYAPVRVVGAYRDTEVHANDPLEALLADLARDGLASRLTVGALDHEDACELAALLLAQVDAEDRSHTDVIHRERVQRMVRRAGGVPYFLVSLALGETAGGAAGTPDEESPEAPVARPHTQLEPAPWQVTTSIRQRVAALPRRAHLLLSALAVAGRSAPFALLAAMLNAATGSLLPAAEAACHARLLEEAPEEWSEERAEGAPSLAVYRFPHDLIRETVLHDLSAARRVALHRAAGEAIESLGAPARRAAQLADHFSQAGEFARALRYALLAGDQARAVSAFVEAERQYRAAVAWARAAQDEAQEADALAKLGALLGATMRYAEGVALLRQALELYADQHNGEAEAHTAMEFALAHDIHGPLEEASAYAAQRLTALSAQGLSTSGQTYLRYGLFHLLMGRAQQLEGAAANGLLQAALAMGQQTQGAARAAQELRILARTTQFLGLVHAQLGQDAAAQASWAEAMPLAEAAGDLQEYARACYNSAALSHARGETAAARRYADQGVAIAIPGTTPRIALWVRAEIAFNGGEWSQARRDAQASVAAARAVNPGATHPPALGLERLIDFLQAEPADESRAATSLAEALSSIPRHFTNASTRAQIASALADRELLAQRPEAAYAHLAPHISPADDVAQWISPLVWASLQMGERAQARHHAVDAVERARARHYQFSLVDALRARALVALDGGAWQATIDDLEEGITVARTLPYPYAEAKALWVYGRLEATRGDLAAARRRFEQALTICVKLGERLYRLHIERALASL